MTISTERVRQYATDEFMFAADDVRAMAAELLAVREAQSVPAAGTCEQEVYEHGKSACMVDIPKHMAEEICRSLSLATGFRIDWHYFGRRVHIKVLAPPASAVPAGFKLVPVEPTPEMIAATEIDGDEYYFESDEAAETWMANKFKAMLAAAPTPTK